jgi:predicted subunit of tRNA(5-methylaminomethyl-2-thiouridylate) methyltransferase
VWAVVDIVLASLLLHLFDLLKMVQILYLVLFSHLVAVPVVAEAIVVGKTVPQVDRAVAAVPMAALVLQVPVVKVTPVVMHGRIVVVLVVAVVQEVQAARARREQVVPQVMESRIQSLEPQFFMQVVELVMVMLRRVQQEHRVEHQWELMAPRESAPVAVVVKDQVVQLQKLLQDMAARV